MPGRDGREGLPPRPRDRGARQPVRRHARRGDRRARRARRAHLGRPRRRLGHICFLEAGVPGGGVRPGRRRPPRARGVGVGPFARPLPARRSSSSCTCPGPTRERRRGRPPHCALPDVRRHTPARALEALLIGALPDHLRRGRGHVRRGVPRGRQDRRARFQANPELTLGTNELATTDPGKPQTILISARTSAPKNNVDGAARRAALGHDDARAPRPEQGDAPRCMSLPRDLKVEIPGHGMDKINAPYSIGGPKLTRRHGQAAHRPADQPRRSTSTSTASRRAVERDRLRVLGRGPRLLQRHAPESTYDQHRAGLPAPVRPGRARSTCATATGHGPRPRRPPAGLPAPGQAAGRRART